MQYVKNPVGENDFLFEKLPLFFEEIWLKPIDYGTRR
jgi:hypothetical protein